MKVKKRQCDSNPLDGIAEYRGGSYQSIMESGLAHQPDEVAALMVLAGEFSADSRLFTAIERGDEAEVAAALRDGAQIEQRDSMGETPLCWAIRQGSVGVVSCLLRHQAKVDNQSVQGFYPLHLAASLSRREMAELLLQYGAEVDVRSVSAQGVPEELARGMTPLHFATILGDVALVEWLLEQGADLTLHDAFGRNALQLSLCAGTEKCALALIAHGAQTEVVESDGTVLKTEQIRVLLEGIVRDLEQDKKLRLKV